MMANENSRTDTAGMTALRVHEGAINHYYNDVAHNCTFGVGTLVHHGVCTPEELQQHVTPEQINSQLAARVIGAERIVKHHVRQQELTQEQFNALVSHVYNMGGRGSRSVLNAADRGNFEEVSRNMNNNVYIHPRDANNRRLAPVRVQGLVNRRRAESAPFQVQPSTPRH